MGKKISVKRYKSEHPYCSNWDMDSEVFPAVVLGNGPSRKSVKLEDLKKERVVYGCNALYRDWEPDFLVANDWRMMLEIIASDYSGRCVFCDFNPLPAETFDVVLDGIPEMDDAEKKLLEYGGKRENSKEYVIRGCSSDRRGNQEKGLSWIDNQVRLEVIWLDESMRHIEWGLTPIGDNLPSTGIMALQLALDNGHKEVELLGFDGLREGNYRNVYDGTPLYQTDGRESDNVRKPETYRPVAADEWEDMFNRLKEHWPDAKVTLR